MSYLLSLHFDTEKSGSYAQSLVLELEDSEELLEIEFFVDKGSENELKDV